MSPAERRRAIDRFRAFPRLECGVFPTPLEEMVRLRAALGGGPRLFIKRDDYAGPGFGGNKVRKLEYVLAQALADGVEVVLTTGGVRSNHARITAALAAKLGLRCVLVLNGSRPASLPASLYLDEAYGAEIHYVARRDERAPTLQRLESDLRGQGRRALAIPLGASIPLGALGFVRAAEELAAQLSRLAVRSGWLFHSTSSGGTQAGLEAGCQMFGLEHLRLVGVSADDPAADIGRVVSDIVSGVGDLLGIGAGAFRRALEIDDHFVGPGYGVPSPESSEALALVARAEGIVLDPVYTAKAMAALLAQVRAGAFAANDAVLFWHTGGQLALFDYPSSNPASA